MLYTRRSIPGYKSAAVLRAMQQCPLQTFRHRATHGRTTFGEQVACKPDTIFIPKPAMERVEKISHSTPRPKALLVPQVLRGLLRMAAGRAGDELHVRLRRLPLQPAHAARVVRQTLCRPA